jgi:hypothetical protein
MATSSTFARCTCRFNILSGMQNDYSKPCIGGWTGFSGCVEFAGASLFTVFVKGAGFSSMNHHQCAWKGRIGIGQWENPMEYNKTSTLERHKNAAPASSKPIKGWRTRLRHPVSYAPVAGRAS